MQSLKILVLILSIFYQSTILFAQKTWTAITTSAEWPARFQHSSVVFEKMWILGGENNGEQLNDVWYSSDGKNWKQACSKAGWLE